MQSSPARTMADISPDALVEIQEFFAQRCDDWEAASKFILKVKASHNRWLALSYTHLIKEMAIYMDKSPMALAIALEREDVFDWLATGLDTKTPSCGSQDAPFGEGVQMGGFRCSPDDMVISFGSVQKDTWEEQAMARAKTAMQNWSRGLTCPSVKARADKKRKQASSSGETHDRANVPPAVRMTRREAADAYLLHSLDAAKCMHAYMLSEINE